jgi:hypothetical protein
MNSLQDRFDRQASWQNGRWALTWAEKIRVAEAIRESIVQIRRTGPAAKTESSAARPKNPKR